MKRMTTREYAKKYLNIYLQNEITQEDLDVLRDNVNSDLWDYPLEEEEHCKENEINVVAVIDCNNNARLREVCENEINHRAPAAPKQV